MLASTDAAWDADREFMDPSDVLVTFVSSEHADEFKDALVQVGLTRNALEQCAEAMCLDLGAGRSRLAIERMFDLAADAESVRDLIFACIASGSRVIDRIVMDALQTNTFTILAELEAPDELTLMFFPVETVEDIELAMASVTPVLAVRD